MTDQPKTESPFEDLKYWKSVLEHTIRQMRADNVHVYTSEGGLLYVEHPDVDEHYWIDMSGNE